jgi:hypothetical protein
MLYIRYALKKPGAMRKAGWRLQLWSLLLNDLQRITGFIEQVMKVMNQ